MRIILTAAVALIAGCGSQSDSGHERVKVPGTAPIVPQDEPENCRTPAMVLTGELDGIPFENRLCAGSGGGFSNKPIEGHGYFSARERKHADDQEQWRIDFDEFIFPDTTYFMGSIKIALSDGRIIGQCTSDQFPIRFGISQYDQLEFSTDKIHYLDDSGVCIRPVSGYLQGEIRMR